MTGEGVRASGRATDDRSIEERMLRGAGLGERETSIETKHFLFYRQLLLVITFPILPSSCLREVLNKSDIFSLKSVRETT